MQIPCWTFAWFFIPVPYPAAFAYDIAAFDAAVIFVVVDGGWTRVDAVFTFGKNGFKIDSAGIKCLSTGCDCPPAIDVEFGGASNVGVFVELFAWLLIAVEVPNEPLPKLTTVAKSLPPPEMEFEKKKIQLFLDLIWGIYNEYISKEDITS